MCLICLFTGGLTVPVVVDSVLSGDAAVDGFSWLRAWSSLLYKRC